MLRDASVFDSTATPRRSVTINREGDLTEGAFVTQVGFFCFACQPSFPQPRILAILAARKSQNRLSSSRPFRGQHRLAIRA